MKKQALTLFICLTNLFCFSQTLEKKQILIPLSNVNGVPYYKDEEVHDFVVDGFEIDSQGNFYFLGGDNVTCLAVFSGNKQIFRKKYKDFPPASLHIYNNTLYTFDNSGKNNNLFALRLVDGSLIKRYNSISIKHFNSYKFVDSSLIVQYLGDPDIFYEQFNLFGQYLNRAVNAYNISPNIIPEKNKNSNCMFLGKWNSDLVFWNITGENSENQTFWLVNEQGKILKTKVLPNNDIAFGKDYYESFPTEHRKIRNGTLYVLGRKGNYALITEVPLDIFFGK